MCSPRMPQPIVEGTFACQSLPELQIRPNCENYWCEENGLKGQQHIAQGNALGKTSHTIALNGHKHYNF